MEKQNGFASLYKTVQRKTIVFKKVSIKKIKNNKSKKITIYFKFSNQNFKKNGLFIIRSDIPVTGKHSLRLMTEEDEDD